MIQDLFEKVEECALKLKNSTDSDNEDTGVALLALLAELKSLSVLDSDLENKTKLVRINSDLISLENKNMKLVISNLIGMIRTSKTLMSQTESVGIVSQAETFIQEMEIVKDGENNDN